MIVGQIETFSTHDITELKTLVNNFCLARAKKGPVFKVHRPQTHVTQIVYPPDAGVQLKFTAIVYFNDEVCVNPLKQLLEETTKE